MSPETRKLIWDAAFEAEVRARYFGYQAGQLRRREKVLTFALSLVSSGAFLAILADTPLAAKGLSLLTAALSVGLATMKFGKASSLSASIYKQWQEIASAYRVLWSQIDTMTEKVAIRRHQELESKHFPLDEVASSEFSIRRSLLKECHHEAENLLKVA